MHLYRKYWHGRDKRDAQKLFTAECLDSCNPNSFIISTQFVLAKKKKNSIDLKMATSKHIKVTPSIKKNPALSFSRPLPYGKNGAAILHLAMSFHIGRRHIIVAVKTIIIDTQTDLPPGSTGSATCVQKFNDSRAVAIRITYRNLLRSSSMWEPRYPPPRVLYIV